MAQINKPTDYFNTKLYTGDGNSTQAITGVGFQPDYIWIKSRGTTDGHVNMDSVRGFTSSTKLCSYDTAAENGSSSVGTYEGYGYVSAVGSDGFTVNKGTGSGGQVNTSSGTYASWNWLAGGTASSNSDGSVTSNVSANTTSGFSIVSWTGTGADATVAHGLNSAPTIYIVKNRTDAADWRVGQVLTSSNNMTDGNGYYLELNDTKASTNPGSAVTWGATPTAPTSSVFTVGSNNAHNGSGDDMIAYCFHSVKGYSKFGSYTGNGSADGTFVYTGFKPAFVIIKDTSAVNNWRLFDNKRPAFNQTDKLLFPSLSSAETVNVSGSGAIDITSNGFKCRSSAAGMNGSGSTFIYMAFAAEPLVGTNNIPATAR